MNVGPDKSSFKGIKSPDLTSLERQTLRSNRNADFFDSIGHKQTGHHDLGQVRFTPQSGHARAHLDTSVKCHRRSLASVYSITSSARASKDGGTLRSRDLAVFRLITRSYLAGACTGRFVGCSPLRMRST